MDDRWLQVRRIFEQAYEVQDQEQRDKLIAKACGDDVSLRAEVESLLVSSNSASVTFQPLRSALFEGFVSEIADEQMVGVRLGPYEILERLAGGGMGTVYKARSVEKNYDRLVAIKVIRPGGRHSRQQIQRFQREIRALARLDHPHIARLWDGGSTADGLPYIVLEYVDGQPINRYCNERKLSINERLRLFIDVCSAVQFAHRNLIVHRDLKPKNIFVTSDGQVKLLDFGIAKLMGEEPEDRTETLMRVMTPQYASPEQVSGLPVTTVSDVYSLGVMLYELLSGRLPYRVAHTDGDSARRAVCDSTPTIPSVAVASPEEHQVATSLRTRPTNSTRLRRCLRGELDTIVMAAMHKDPMRRYESVERLAEDIGRYLEGLPIRARRDSFLYRSRKFVKRNLLATILAVFAIAAALLGTAGTMHGLFEARQARLTAEQHARRAKSEARRAENMTDFLISIVSAASPEQLGRTATVEDVLKSASMRIDDDLVGAEESQIAALAALGLVFQRMGLLQEAERHYEKELEVATDAFGPESMQVSSALNNLGQLLNETGDLETSRAYLERSVELSRRLAGPTALETGRSIDNLQMTMQDLNRLAEAEALAGESLAIRELNLTSDDPELLSAKNNFATLLANLGRYSESRKLHQSVLEVRKRQVPSDSLSVATSLSNLASVESSLRNYHEAASLYREALDIRLRRLGPNHPDIALASCNLASILVQLGQLADAEVLIRKALEIDRHTFGGDHVNVAHDLNILGKIALDRKDFLGAEQHFAEAAEIVSKRLGDTHPIAITARKNLELAKKHLSSP